MTFIIIAAAVCAADQLLKYWVAANIAVGGYVPLLPGVIGLTHARNTGAAFSLLSEHTWILAAVSIVASLVILYFILAKKLPFWEKFALALVLGGAVGNAIDRAVLGYVVDMFSLEFVNFAIFNLADAFIDVGAALFLVLYIIRTSREDKNRRMPELDRLRKNLTDEDIGHDD